MKKNKRRGIGISQFKQSINKPEPKPEPKPFKEEEKKEMIKDLNNMKEETKQKMEMIQPKNNNTNIRIKKINSLKTMKNNFDNSDDKLLFLMENEEEIKNMNKKHIKDFINYVRNTYLE